MTVRRLRGGCWFSFPWHLRSTQLSKSTLEPAIQSAYAGFRVTVRPNARRVIRGGSWFDEAGPLRSAKRDAPGPACRSRLEGFRVVVRS